MRALKKSAFWLAGMIPLAVAGCGGTPTASLAVTCDGKLVLAGTDSVQATGSNLLFPDPANTGQTGTISLSNGQRCVIKPVIDTSDKSPS